jgi:hypothetical protein
VTHAHTAAFLALAAIATSCRSVPPDAIHPDMASCIPGAAAILAGLNLDQLRAGPLYPKLPPALLALVEPLRPAGYTLFASDGTNLLAISRGLFREAPSGATLLAPDLAIAGTPELLRAALAQHRAGTIAAPDLLTHAQPLAAAHPIWIVVRGSVTLPLTGNLANLNRLLHSTEYTTIAADLRDSIALQIEGVCRTPDAGRQLEQSLRAILSLTAAASARQPQLAAMLRAIQIRRDESTVHVTLATGTDALDRLLKAF